ncbi:IS30 family transposase [Pleionea sp. CnH1-48]|uniref:IS30 family transposase n=1 Tax=Pleionea sp. CnH1-48 TaxID=2954494 RepID=UPI002097C73A|nr:IS30 family transposase [Pleionea sp. CnH1-48]MCO7225564.1 IS30 family transposase [Pleionea sp. CnH1-48]
MKRTYTREEKELVFDLWKQGAGYSDISRVIDAKPGSIFTILRDHGGIKPSKRNRAIHHLTIEEREEIRAGLSAKMSIRSIAKMLGRAPSTISREIKRNRGRRWYKAVDADRRAWRMAKRPKLCALASNTELKKLVIQKLQLKWSPEQISGWLKVSFPRQNSMHLSHETIYKTLYVRSRKTLHHSLAVHLRRSHKMRHSKHHSRSGDRGTINIVNGVSIHQRPKNAEIRKSIGHWEGDLVSGSRNTHIATLVDRKTRFTLILKLKGKDSGTVNNALIDVFKKLPAPMKKSLTWDRGMELAKHAEFTKATKIPVYFCDPQCPWQRGTNENTNSLIRQYFPKKTCLAQHSQKKLNEVATHLNERPRKVLKFRTPKEMMEKALR